MYSIIKMDIAFGFQQFNLTIIFSFMLLQLNICSLFWICWRFLNTNFVNAHLYLTWIDQSEPSCARAGRYNSRSLRPIHRRDAILKACTDPNTSPSDWSEWSVAVHLQLIFNNHTTSGRSFWLDLKNIYG